MRITNEYEMDKSLLPLDYLRGFISLIKAVFQEIDKDFYRKFYENPTMKAFTFGVYFPDLKGKEGNYFNVGRKITFNFSSNDYEALVNIYNGFLKKKEYPLFNNKIYLKDIKLLPPKIIHGNEKIFKTISPFVVNYLGDNKKFLVNGEKGFIEGIEFSIKECAKEFLGKETNNIAFEPLDLRNYPIHHYQMMSVNKGLFRLKADNDVLQMVYDLGIGIHRSQGFGLLEVVK